jgi:hypothetical protein
LTKILLIKTLYVLCIKIIVLYYKKMNEDIKKYIQEGIHFSNELMDAIEDISQKYQEHISMSMQIGHFDDLDKVMMDLSRTLIKYSYLIRNFQEEKRGLETISEE